MRRRKQQFSFSFSGSACRLAVALKVGMDFAEPREVVLLLSRHHFLRIDHHGTDSQYDFSFSRDTANEQHDAFFNAVTHELKTPIDSIKLYLETLKSRGPPWTKETTEFYDVMLPDSDRLLEHRRAGLAGGKHRRETPLHAPDGLGILARFVAIVRTQRNLRRRRGEMSRRPTDADRNVRDTERAAAADSESAGQRRKIFGGQAEPFLSV